MGHESDVVTLGDGRLMEVATVGDPTGPTVVFHHGTPGSAVLIEIFEPLAASRGVFVVTTSRAGYGRSSRHAGRRAADVVTDTEAVLDHLGRDQYVTVGWSGGGPHALACAALGAPRCLGALSLAGVAPVDAGFDWTEGMAAENVAEFALAQQGGEEYEAHIKFQSDVLVDATAQNIVELMGGLLSPVDVAAMARDDDRDIMARAFAHGSLQGHYGFLDDDHVFMHPWGFELADIAVPVEVWYGDQDLMVPPTHGAFLATAIRSATAFHQPDAGHISIVANYRDDVFDHIVALTAR